MISADNTSPRARPRKRWWFLLASVALFALLVGIDFGVRRERNRRSYSVPLRFVQMAVPVVCEIVYRPEIKYPEKGQPIATLSGPAEFIFTNYSNESVKMAFPPVRVFGFSENQFTYETTVPEFARERKTYDLPAGESIRFETDHGSTVLGTDPHAYLKGGPGYIGFVFSRPADAAADDNYLVGTIMPWCSIYTQDGSSDEEEMTRAAKFNFGSTKYTEEGSFVRDQVLWESK